MVRRSTLLGAIASATLLATPSFAAQIFEIDLSMPDADGYVFGSTSFDWPPEGGRSQIEINFSGLELIDGVATGYVDATATWWDADIGAVTGNNYFFVFDCGTSDLCLAPRGETSVAGYVSTPSGYQKPCGPATVGNCSFQYDPQNGSFDGYFRVLDTSAPYSATLTIGEVTAIPEPQIWTLMIAGFGGVGATLRRRRKLRWRWAPCQ